MLIFTITAEDYFYPRSPCGERLRGQRLSWGECLFLSTLSLRRATRAKSGQQRSRNNFYPRSPCGERLNCSRNGFAMR